MCISKGNIGLNAGTVWNILGDNPSLSFEALKMETSLPDDELWTAIGWLARENKIEIDTSNTYPIFYPGTNFYY